MNKLFNKIQLYRRLKEEDRKELAEFEKNGKFEFSAKLAKKYNDFITCKVHEFPYEVQHEEWEIQRVGQFLSDYKLMASLDKNDVKV
jgi:rRNA pseudouridine-1189 N-methylase Emg1 (Nep1/Mra1 family)